MDETPHVCPFEPVCSICGSVNWSAALQAWQRDRAVDLKDQRITALKAGLREACDGWAYAAQYKGDYFVKKHHDLEDIARLRKVADGE